ncbi:MAG TPA: metallophosphoesterase [Phycisphaerales bacterium]|nr:metallophosphoesterase [Phycisphaerales bacterium]
MKFVALSDTHNLHLMTHIPEGDVLLFGGDMCGRGTLEEVEKFGEFLSTLPHEHKVVIAGNHDWPFEREPEKARKALGDVIYLEDEEVIIEGVKIYGSPWQPVFFNWAFNLERGEPLRKVWSKIPDDTDVLLTHGPPYDILDRCYDGRRVGCQDLRDRVSELKQLKAHIFGHIHEGYGRHREGDCTHYNASICDLGQRRAENVPWLFEI